MKISLRYLFLFLCAVNITSISFGQCLMVPLSLSERVAKSDAIIGGHVLNQFCFESNHEGHIYTANLVEGNFMYKGSIDTFYIITQGGDVGNRSEKVIPSLTLHLGDHGIFFCTKPFTTPSQKMKFPCFSAYGDAQGFIKYDEKRGIYYDVFNHYESSNTAYPHYAPIIDSIISYTKSGFSFQFHWTCGKDAKYPIENIRVEEEEDDTIYRTGFLIDPITTSHKTTTNPSITSLSPTTISAGTFSVLTINGSGFGVTRGTGTVSFSFMNGDGTYITPHPSQYVSWSDAQIQVMVPDMAGSGNVKVTQGGVSTQSYDSIYVPYDVEQWVHNDTAYEYLLSDMDSAGGYRWYMNATMANTTPALATFTRAMDEWRCTTHINWLYGGTTTIDTSGSGRCVVRFGQTNELALGVLGTLHWINYWCLSAGQPKTQIAYYDMVISSDYVWCYGPQQPQQGEVDLQTIMEHEFGHAHLINHVNGPQSDFMHSTTPNGQSARALSTGDVTGGSFSLGHSVGQIVCSVPAHTYYTQPCPNGISETSSEMQLSIYPNPSNDKIIVKGTGENGTIEIYDNTGRKLLTNTSKNNYTELNIPDLATGLYFGRYTLDGITATFRFLKY